MNEPDVSSLLTVAEAIRVIDSASVSPRIEGVKLVDAQGLVLAESIFADRDYPPFNKSLMDGYAVRSNDLRGESATFRCIGEIPAGGQFEHPIEAAQTVKIMTGAPLPPGADAVVPVELVKQIVGDIVTLKGPARPGRYIAQRGSDCPSGQVVLERGQRLEAPQLAVAATVGASDVQVFARPRVAILATGDEIVDFDQTPGPAQIRNCNSIMLLSLLRRLKCDVTDLGTASDEVGVIRKSIERGLEFDALFVTGGMSMGDRDYVPRVLQELGIELRITKLRIKPGKPFVFGVAPSGANFVFGLPGNPVSGFACVVRLCSGLLARIGANPVEEWSSVKLTSPLNANGPREFYQPAVMEHACVTPLPWKGSGDVFTLALANCLLVRPENDPPRAVGDIMNVLEIPS